MLRYLDGELSARRGAPGGSATWKPAGNAGAELDELQKDGRPLRPLSPVGPGGSAPTAASHGRTCTAISRASIPPRLGGMAGAHGAPLSAAHGVAVGCQRVGGGHGARHDLSEFRRTPSVHAAELLQKAVAVERASPKPAATFAFEPRRRRSPRVIGGASVLAARTGRDEKRTRHPGPVCGGPLRLGRPAERAVFPGMARQLSRKSDEVATIQDPQRPDRNCYQIHTSAESGEVARASLNLRVTDSTPRKPLGVSQPGMGGVERDTGTTMSHTNSNEHLEFHRGRQNQACQPPPCPGNRPRSPTELQVVATLHEIGADLGDPVEVARSGGRVLVGGTGIPPRHQKQIHASLDSMPGVVVRFPEPGAGGAPSGPEGTPPETPALAR